MNLSSLASAVGAAFTGYGTDRTNALKQAMLSRGMDNEDLDRTLRLRQAGYAPVSDLQTALSNAQGQPVTAGVTLDSAPTGQVADPAALAKEIAGNIARNRSQAKELETNVAGSFAVPQGGTSQRWAQLPFEQTPTGLAIRKGNELQRAEQGRITVTDAAKEAAKARDEAAKELRLQQRDYNTLVKEFPTHALATGAFDKTNPANYTAALADARDQRKLTAAAALAEKKTAGQAALLERRLQVQHQNDKDQSQMEFAYTTAKPSIAALRDWYSQDRNPGAIASTLGKLPMVGNAITGSFDKDFQLAKQHAHTVAQQWAEMQPKMRFQPNTVKLIEDQIMPELGDSPAKRKAKADLIDTYERSMQKRAKLTVTDPFADITPGAPETPPEGSD